jgi:putative ABC transport system ATP-binding protein
MTNMIETVDLSKTYMQGGRPLEVLKGVCLTVEQGEFMAIMGPSGSGKSTLLNMIGALDRPTSGKVFINGVDLSKLNDNQVADLRNKEIGFIFQFFNLIHRMDARGNVELPMAIAGVPRGQRHRRAIELLDLVGLADRADHKPSQLSGGEQQRVAIARALVKQPRLLLADEPTGSVDSETGRGILSLLWEQTRSRGMTAVIVTHNNAFAQMGDVVLRLRSGQIAEVAAGAAIHPGDIRF